MRRKRITSILGVSCLCVIFYALGAWQGRSITPSSQFASRVGCNEGTTGNSDDHSPSSDSPVVASDKTTTLDFESHHQLVINTSEESEIFPPCEAKFIEYTPCNDRQRGRQFDRDMLKYRERHCPTKDELLRCLVPAPPHYKAPFKWPQSRDYAWIANIPHKELSIEKANQNWIQVEGDRFRFPGGGTGFPRGADAYIDEIAELIPLKDGSIRTALDTGCGVRRKQFIILKIKLLRLTPRGNGKLALRLAPRQRLEPLFLSRGYFLVFKEFYGQLSVIHTLKSQKSLIFFLDF